MQVRTGRLKFHKGASDSSKHHGEGPLNIFNSRVQAMGALSIESSLFMHCIPLQMKGPCLRAPRSKEQHGEGTNHGPRAL